MSSPSSKSASYQATNVAHSNEDDFLLGRETQENSTSRWWTSNRRKSLLVLAALCVVCLGFVQTMVVGEAQLWSSAPTYLRINDGCFVSDDCISGAPHFDPQGQICLHDDEKNQGKCDYSMGPNECAYCPNGKWSDYRPWPRFRNEDFFVKDGCMVHKSTDACVQGPSRYDPEGMECGLSGTPWELKCKFSLGDSACAFCP